MPVATLMTTGQDFDPSFWDLWPLGCTQKAVLTADFVYAYTYTGENESPITYRPLSCATFHYCYRGDVSHDLQTVEVKQEN